MKEKKIWQIPVRRRILIEEIKNNGAKKIFKKIFELNVSQEPILCVINSPGGQTEEALKIYDTFRFSKARIIGLAVQVDSGGILPLLGCKEKYCLPHSTFFFHEPKVKFEISLTRKTKLTNCQAFIEAEQQGFMETMKRFVKVIISKTKIEEEKLYELFSNNATIFAEEAKRIGLVDDIIDDEKEITNLIPV